MRVQVRDKIREPSQVGGDMEVPGLPKQCSSPQREATAIEGLRD